MFEAQLQVISVVILSKIVPALILNSVPSINSALRQFDRIGEMIKYSAVSSILPTFASDGKMSVVTLV
jgi:hypothetical protein